MPSLLRRFAPQAAEARARFMEHPSVGTEVTQDEAGVTEDEAVVTQDEAVVTQDEAGVTQDEAGLDPRNVKPCIWVRVELGVGTPPPQRGLLFALLHESADKESRAARLLKSRGVTKEAVYASHRSQRRPPPFTGCS